MPLHALHRGAGRARRGQRVLTGESMLQSVKDKKAEQLSTYRANAETSRDRFVKAIKQGFVDEGEQVCLPSLAHRPSSTHARTPQEVPRCG